MAKILKILSFPGAMLVVLFVLFFSSSPVQAATNIRVDWNKQPKIVKSTDTLWNNSTTIAGLAKYNKNNKDSQPVDRKWLTKNFKVYEIGKVKNGVHAQKKLYLFIYRPIGDMLIGRESYFRVVFANGRLNLLSLNSDEAYENSLASFVFFIDKLNIISNHMPDKEIAIPGTNQKLVYNTVSQWYIWVSEIKKPRKLFLYKNNTIYQDENGCIIIAAADGTALEYRIKYTFIDTKNRPSTNLNEPQTFRFTWNNGKANNIEYITRREGCYGDCLNYATYITNANKLKLVGQDKKGNKFYEMKSTDTKERPSDKKSLLQTIYENYYPGFDDAKQKDKSKMSFKEFLSNHPLIFWRDPFGRFVEFINAKFPPAAECGKPVIYLYPEKTINLKVKVSPNGGISQSEPAYNDGWNVEAHPNGAIFNYADKKSYPSLYWEGRGLNYIQPAEGFVTSRENVEKVLREKLTLLGLNNKEIEDFNTYWLPRLQKYPYYFLTFLPQPEFDKIAPLTVSVKPDTIIRIFMDFKGLNKPIKAVEPKIITPIRKGFVVVEWGGAKHE
jgi:hypothetical protein